MAKTVRLSYHAEGGGRGLVNLQAAVLVPSSEETSHPRMALTRAGIGDKWRSKTGWTIAAGVNDGLAHDLGIGPVFAAVAAGQYTTGSALATAIAAALELASPARTWTCTYSAVTHKFTITCDANVVLPFGSPAGDEESIHRDLGFADSDTANATTHVADNASYQSRHWINADLGSAQQSSATFVAGHNVSDDGIVRMDMHTATLVTVALGPGTGDYQETVPGTEVRALFLPFSPPAYQFLRLVISDVSNPIGFAEVAIWYNGPYVAPTRLQNNGRVRDPEHLSEIIPALGGAHQQLRRAIRDAWSLTWKLFDQTQEDLWDALNEAVRLGGSFFLTFDADNPTTSTVYGHFRKGPRFDYGPGEVRTMNLVFAETL